MMGWGLRDLMSMDLSSMVLLINFFFIEGILTFIQTKELNTFIISIGKEPNQKTVPKWLKANLANEWAIALQDLGV